MNPDFDEMLSALSDAGAEFLIVGAHALAAHGHPRATGDLDIWVRPTPENAHRVWRALGAFGAPLADLTVDELARPGLVFQIGGVAGRHVEKGESRGGDTGDQICSDDMGLQYSPGGIVAVTDQPGALARCMHGRWIAYDFAPPKK